MAKRNRNDDTINDGNVIVDEDMNRRDGLVEYEGTTEGRDPDVETHGPGSMQAGATVFEGTATKRDRPVQTESGGGIFDTTSSNELLGRIREGMSVVDANGDDIGKVDEIRMGDPAAATVEGQEMDRNSTIVDDAATAFGAREDGPDVPEPFRSELMREGYIRVDGKGWIDTDRYLRSADIADVVDNTVRLRVAKEALPSDKM
jgi:hypothetical protein